MTGMLPQVFLAGKLCTASVSDAKFRWIGLSLSRWRARSTRWGQRVPPHHLLSAIHYQLFLRNFKAAGLARRVRPVAERMAAGPTARMAVLFSLLIAPISSLGAAKNPSVSPQLAGYKTVRVHYGPLNKMIMPVHINGQPANLLVDTGSNEIILDTDAAATFGVGPSPRGLRYVGFTEINGQLLPVAFMQSLTAASMNFGSNPVGTARFIPFRHGKGSSRWRSWAASFTALQNGDQLPNATCFLQSRSVASHEPQRCGFLGKIQKSPDASRN